MSLVYAGVCSHGPGITARADRADPVVRDEFYRNLDIMRQDIVDSGAEALIVIAAEHFANFFMNNMPAYCIGMADQYEGPIEDPEWLKIKRTTVPGNADLSKRLITEVMQTVDTAFSEEWKFDHGISVPLNFLTPEYDMPIIPANINCQGPPLTPLKRAWEFGEAIRRACDSVPEKVALVGTGGISHWPATPDSGKINLEWDTEFMRRFAANDKDAMLDYSDVDIYAEAGQGGYEIRTLIATAAAARGAKADVHFFEPIPIFATSCICASFQLSQTSEI
jgi:aromatic ring-opening dioxygenase catalytic subunit (LigB family)